MSRWQYLDKPRVDYFEPQLRIDFCGVLFKFADNKVLISVLEQMETSAQARVGVY